MGIAEFIIARAFARRRWRRPSYALVDQHPLQMLVTLPSSLSFSLTAARVAEWRDPDGASRARFILTDRCTGDVR
jgi:hypothetical protein